MQFDAQGQLIAGSMVSGQILSIDRYTGAVRQIVGPPRGIADDLASGPDGTIVWSTMPLGIVHARRPDGRVEELTRNLPYANGLYFGPGGLAQLPGGRLVVAEVGRKRVVAFDPATLPDQAPLEVFADGLPIGLPPFMGPPKAFTPTGVVADAQGRL